MCSLGELLGKPLGFVNVSAYSQIIWGGCYAALVLI